MIVIRSHLMDYQDRAYAEGSLRWATNFDSSWSKVVSRAVTKAQRLTKRVLFWACLHLRL
jgi:hypothetical protein